MVQTPNPDDILIPDIRRERAGHQVKSTLLRVVQLYTGSISTKSTELERALVANHYQLLGVSTAATATEIRRAYKQVIATFHPDLHSNPLDKKLAEKVSVKVNSALECLLNPPARVKYDAEQKVLSSRSRQAEAQRTAASPKPRESPTPRYREAEIRAEAERLRKEKESAESVKSKKKAEPVTYNVSKPTPKLVKVLSSRSRRPDAQRTSPSPKPGPRHRAAQTPAETEQLRTDKQRAEREKKAVRATKNVSKPKAKIGEEEHRYEDFLRRFLYHYHLQDELQEISAFIDFHGNLELKRKLGKVLQKHCRNRGFNGAAGLYDRSRLWANVKDYDTVLQLARVIKREIGQ